MSSPPFPTVATSPSPTIPLDPSPPPDPPSTQPEFTRIPTNHLSWANLFKSSISGTPSAVSILCKIGESTSDGVKFTVKDIEDSITQWQLVAIGKFLGRARQEIKKRWRIKGHVQVLDLTKGYFCFKFSLSEDIDQVLAEGPWTVRGQCLSF